MGRPRGYQRFLEGNLVSRRDFNVIRLLWERNRDHRQLGAMRSFSYFIDELELKDLPVPRNPYPCKGEPNNQRKARLDRFLVSDD